MDSRAETSAETEDGVGGFLHFGINSFESVWIELHRVRIYLWVVEHVPGVQRCCWSAKEPLYIFYFAVLKGRTRRWAGRMSLLGDRTPHKRRLCEEREGDLHLRVSFFDKRIYKQEI